MSKEQQHAAQLMPNSEKAVLILKERAKELAKLERDKTSNTMIPYVSFSLKEGEKYGVPFQFVQEILHDTKISKPPFVPNFIAGVANWRGNLITIIDLHQFFHKKLAVHLEKPNEYIIIISMHTITIGFLIHSIDGNDTYQAEELSRPLNSVSVASPDYIIGLHHATIALLNIEVLVSGIVKEIKERLLKIGETHGGYKK